VGLVVAGDGGDFQKDVLALLQTICPCQDVTLEDGVVVLGTKSGCCCENRHGCSLLGSLVSGPLCTETITIEKSACNSYYDGSKYVVKFCPDQRLPSCDEERDVGPAVTLAHELMHALLHCEGSAEYNSDSEEEHVACGENQIREEMNEPLRCTYGGTRIDPDCGWLPDLWEPDQECGGWSLFVCYVRRVFRWFLALLARILQSLAAVFTTRDLREPADDGVWGWTGPSTLQHRVAQAYWVRARDPNARRVDRLIEGLESRPQPVRYVMLEKIKVDFPYLVTLVYFDAGTPVVVTNWSAVGAPWPTRRPHLARLRFPPGEAGTLGEFTFAAGVGGRESIVDGTLTILTIGPGDEVSARAILYGVDLHSEEPGMEPPSSHEDRSRWEAMNQFMDLRATLMDSRGAAAIELLTRPSRRPERR
jgi:hypothetical protein